MRGAPPLLILLAAGCASGPAAPPADPGGPSPPVVPATAEESAGRDFRIECDRVRVNVPEGLRGRTEAPPEGAPGPWEVAVGTVRIHVREIPPEIAFGGEDLTVVAEGIVRVRRTEGRFSTEEGPYRTVFLRNGRMLAR